ncbi:MULTISPECIES: hypothetical protein [unclassified Streptomyces]|uniref:hypothetical protein n=1 Tax=unclassified Streptomyces TaxID=2593676 RepID=UPI000747977D|nr:MULTISPECIES: hypothetical protein [unclassified Streptomyces]KUL73957.1 hypothetical protein ADL34_19035 [Streptomyces sp. NRRL WC-3605]KUL74384.1 hypothetical protein ADL33_18000 [Streptomyces sp. NRRL WC-3604]
MNVPSKLTALAARLIGKNWAHESAEELAAALDKQIDQLREANMPEHLAGAASLTSAPAFQPGLVDLRGDIYDAAVYLDALTTSATATGNVDLVDALREAGEAAHELVARLAAAAHATIPAPAVPVTSRVA